MLLSFILLLRPYAFLGYMFSPCLYWFQTVTRTEGFDDALIGANASAEEATETNESSTVSGVDIVLNHNLQETGFDKKGYLTYIKDYMKSWVSVFIYFNPTKRHLPVWTASRTWPCLYV